MDILNAIYEEIINFLGLKTFIFAFKTGNYDTLASFDGVMSCLLVALPILLFVEFFIVLTREREQLKTYKVNFLIIVVNRIIGRLLSISVMIWSIGYFQKFAPFQTTYTWYWFIYGYIVWELGSYIYHYFGHKVRILWCLHSPHHAAENMNLSVNQAHFFLEFPYADFVRTSICMLLGVDPKLFISILLLDITYATFIHIGEHMLPNGRLGILNKFILTPSHHRVHHGSNPLYMDTNFCNLLNIWDKIFGTHQDEKLDLKIQYGITREMNASNFWDVYFGEFVALYKDVKRASGIKNKFLYIFMPPGWNETGQHETAKIVRDEYLKNSMMK